MGMSKLASLPCLLALALSAHAAPVTIPVTFDDAHQRQTIDGFGTCTYGEGAAEEWFQKLFLESLRCSMLRIDFTPRFVEPYSTDLYNSPWFHNRPPLPGPDDNNVRTYSGPEDYTREYAGKSVPISVMQADPEKNLHFFNYKDGTAWASALLAQKGGEDLVLVGSLWSPVPWVKRTSGYRYGNSDYPMPKKGAPWPFIWGGNFAGGVLDTSNEPLALFNDGDRDTSALEQFARSTASYILGWQRTFNLKLDYFSIQNEPNFEVFYNSCLYPSGEGYRPALEAIRAAFDAHPELRHIQLVGPEDLLGGGAYSLWQYGGGKTARAKNLQYLRDIDAQPGGVELMPIAAIHGYAPDGKSSAGAEAQPWIWWREGWKRSPAEGIPGNVAGYAAKGRKSWMTETSGEDPAWLGKDGKSPHRGAWSVALKIHQALTTGQQSAYIYWQMADGKKLNDQALTDKETGEGAGKFTAARHYFAAIPAGSACYAVDEENESILASAYLQPGGERSTIVLLNASDQLQEVRLDLDPGWKPLALRVSSEDSLWQKEDPAANFTLPVYGIATLMIER